MVVSLYAISSGAMPPTENIGCTYVLSLEEILEFEFHLSSTLSLSFLSPQRGREALPARVVNWEPKRIISRESAVWAISSDVNASDFGDVIEATHFPKSLSSFGSVCFTRWTDLSLLVSGRWASKERLELRLYFGTKVAASGWSPSF